MAKKKPITVEDLWKLERIGTPSLSPDGAQAVAAVTRYSMDDNQSASSLWLLSTLGGALRDDPPSLNVSIASAVMLHGLLA